MNQDQQRSQTRRRRRYDEEFERNAAELLEQGERSAVQLSQELGVSDCSLGRWKRQYGHQGRDALSRACQRDRSNIVGFWTCNAGSRRSVSLVCPTWVQCSQMKGIDRKQ